MSYCREEGKDKIIFVTEADHNSPSLSTVKLLEDNDDDDEPGLILPNGDINWNCPCLGGMASGPCGVEFREAFSCFHYSTAEAKGSDCFEPFRRMQDCMVQYPEVYPRSEPMDEDRDDDLDEFDDLNLGSLDVRQDGGKPLTNDDKPPTNDDKPPTTDDKPPVNVEGPRASGDEARIIDDKPPSADSKPPTVDDRPPTSVDKPRTTGDKSATADLNLPSNEKVTGDVSYGNADKSRTS